MNKLLKLLKFKSFGIRLLSSIVILILVSIFIALGSQAGKPGKIIAFIMIFSLGIYAFSETIIASIKIYKYFLIMGVISIFVIFALNYKLVLDGLNYSSTSKHSKDISEIFQNLFSLWVFIIPFLFIIPVMFFKNHDDKSMVNNIFFVILLIIILVLFIEIMFLLVVIKWSLIIYIIFIAIIFDTMAYVGGILFGHKFIKLQFSPRFSPKKSWEGFIVGYISAFTFAIIFGYYLDIWRYFVPLTFWWIISAAVLPIACQIGDLFFSCIKRSKKIKDFSKLIPGHGGIIDRIDGIIFIVILFAAMYDAHIILMQAIKGVFK